jgi:TrmH family RNA methyltransferase
MASWQKYLKLHQKKFRKEWQLFMVEGKRFSLEALRSNWQVKTAFFDENFQKSDSSPIFSDLLQEKNITPQILSSKDFKKLSITDTPQGILLIMAIPGWYKEAGISLNNIRMALLIEGVRDPGNFGTIIRTADWFGAQLIISSNDCAEVFNPKTLRASMGSVFRVVCIKVADFFKWIKKLKEDNFFLIGTSSHTGLSLHQIKSNYPLAICLGSESEGISPPISKMVDLMARIPQYGKGESLNVAVASGIILNYFASQNYELHPPKK